MTAPKIETDIAGELEARVEDLGYELVDLRWAGSGRRPLLKLRIDVPGSAQGAGITVDDCAKVSRALERWLDDLDGLSDRYVLEVSSPGVNRPLVRDRDFERFAGETIAVSGKQVLADRATRLEGTLVGLEGAGTPDEMIVLRLASGDEVRVARTDVRKAHLVFTWK